MTATTPSDLGSTGLRPVERVMRRLVDGGMTEADIAWRFRRTPGHIRRVLELSRLRPHQADRDFETRHPLRPIERLVLRARRDGADSVEIAARLRRSPRSVDQNEKLATYKLEQQGPDS
jgi:DNA-binding NarL/FixJ family response regulator